MKNQSTFPEIIEKVCSELIENADEKTKENSLRFFKEDIKLYGVKTAVTHKIAKENFKLIKDKPKKEIFALCEQFWSSGNIEQSVVACDWSYSLHKKYEAGDFQIFEKWINTYVSNWASCDTLCNHTVGEFIEMYPEHIANLKGWTKSSNRWMKRAAAVSLIIPARKGKFLEDIFEIANNLLGDQDDLVQKGYGWMLKAASQAHEKLVFDYVMSKKKIMPRTAFRYAIEKMSPELKAKAMEK